MATQYSNKPIVTNGLVYALDFGNQKSYVSGSSVARSLVFNPTPATFQTVPAGDYQGLAAAYSVRKVVSSYTGSAMMIQSASVSQSIGFDSNGNLDTASIAAFAGSGNAFVKIWYDQSGNNNHASQSVLANQPQIYSGSQGSVIIQNGRPALYFNADALVFSNLHGRPLLDQYFTVTTTDLIYIYPLASNGPYGFTAYQGSTDPGTSAGYGSPSLYANGTILPTNTRGGVYNFLTGSKVVVHQNANTSTWADYKFADYSGGGYEFEGFLQELVAYTSSQANNRTNLETNINSYYNIYTPRPNPIPGFTSGLANFISPDALLTNQTFTGFSYDRGNSTIMYVGETKGTSSLFTQDTNLSVVATTSSVGFGSTSNNLGRTYPVSGLKHVTLRFSSGSVDCFVNGIPVPANSVFPTGSSVAGGKFAIPVYTGSLGLFQVYNRPLTGDEIWSNYQLTAPRYGLGAVQNKPYTLDDNAYLFLSQSGITDPIITSSINTFVLGLKSASLWDKMIAIYPFVGTGSVGVNLTGSHRWNLKEPSLVTYPLSFTGSWNGSVSGSTPSGSNTNITAGGTTPSIYYPNYSTSSAHISILSYDTPTSSSFLAGTGIDTETAVSTLAGDYGTPAAAYSVRKVRTAYSGALMDVRRSYDNTTGSIGYVSNGDLDTGSLLDWVVPGRNNLPGEYSGLAAAYSLRRVSASYAGFAVKVRGDIENQTRDIGFDASGNLDTGSLLNFTATGSNTLAGSYSGLAAAYSLRRVVPGYAGDAIEVQSGSVSQSIGFDSIGNLDTGSLLTFVGSGNGFVKTWYDQSGNNNHATQSVATSQPQIVSSGVIMTESGKPTLKFDGNDELSMSGLFGQSTLDTYFVTSTSDTQYLYPNFGGGSYGFVAQSGSTSTGLNFAYGSPSLYTNGTLFTGTTRENVYNFLNGTKLIIHQGANTSTWTTYTFGKYGSWEYSGSLQELIAYTSSQASNRTFIENNINAYYNIYTTSSVSTENAFVNTWYDQSGNNRHATQTTSSRQPLIVSSGSLVTENGKPALRFLITNSSSLDLPGSPLSGSNAFGLYAVANFSSSNLYEMLYAEGTTTPNVEIRRDSTNNNLQWITGDGTFPPGTATIDNRQVLVSINRNALVSNTAFVNGTLDATLTTSSNAITSTTASIGKRSDGYYFDGTIQEMSFFTGSAASSSRSAIENNINNYYSIYTGSNDGFVARWYDQSGNNNHATQTATGSQPLIVSSGSLVTENGKPALRFDGVDDHLNLTQITPNTDWSMFGTGARKASLTIMTFLGSSNGSINSTMAGGSIDNKAYLNNGTQYRETTSTYTTTSQTLWTGIVSSSLPHSIYLNSSLQNSIAVNATITQGFTHIGRYNNLYSNATLTEILLYQSDQSSNRQSVEYGINNYYNIYPQTSSFTTSSFTIKATPTGITGAINNQPLNGISSTGPVGFITVSRTGSNALTIARNGVTSSFTVPASGALSTGIYLGASNYNGITVGSSPLGISFASVGIGLNNNETQTLNRQVQLLKYNLQNPSIVTSSLVLNLDALIPSSYPGTGNTWFDLSGNGYNGTLTNGPTFANDNGGVIMLDGSNDYIDCGTNIRSVLHGNAGITFEGWYNLANITTDDGLFTVRASGDGNWFWNIRPGGTDFWIGYSTSAATNIVTITNPFTGRLNTWTHIATSFTSGSLVTYINGAAINTTTTVGGTVNMTSGAIFTIGNYTSPGSYGMQGKIGSFRTYNRNLSASEVLQNYNATRGRFGV